MDALHFRWELDLKSSPEKLWDYVADTDRLNHDIGFSPIKRLDDGDILNNRYHASQVIQGFLVQEWIEEPFQWVKPYHYNTTRNYVRGIFKQIQQAVEMQPLENGGTHIDYQIWVTPRYGLLRGLIRNSFSNMDFPSLFRRYDALIQNQPGEVLQAVPILAVETIELVAGGDVRLEEARQQLIAAGANQEVVIKLTKYLQEVDDLSAAHIRPYMLADIWGVGRRDVLDACLYATRVGLLDMSWGLLCPLCRGAKASSPTLAGITDTVHCDTCRIDYSANFEQSVELTFKPNASIRRLDATDFCVGGPEITPHIMVNQLLRSGETRTITAVLRPGQYRARTLTLPGEQLFSVREAGEAALTLRASSQDGWMPGAVVVQPTVTVTLKNTTDTEQLFVIEHLAWSEQAVVAADVTTRQTFRDLFSSEALRPNEQISISSITLVFTDLRSSTQMYREVGDAPAFGLVMEHFDILREAIRSEDGAIVKTIGDAVMAVFNQPERAVAAMLKAHTNLAHPESAGRVLNLRVGIHTGKCIAVTLNERLDYFGSTVNIAARLEGQSNGSDMVVSEGVYKDTAVQELLTEMGEDAPMVESYETSLKGFTDETFTLYRLMPHTME